MLRNVPEPLFEFAGTLTILDLSFNKLTALPDDIAGLDQLATLNVRNNHISQLPSTLYHLKNLEEVVLSMNRFSAVPPVLYSMPRIVSIVITDNQIADIDATSLRKLPKLNCLDLTNNSIARVPPELGLLPACKSLKLEGNCFKIPRPTILSKGTPAVMEYLKDRCPIPN